MLSPMEFEENHIEHGLVSIARELGWNSATITFDRPFKTNPQVFVEFNSSNNTTLLQFTPFVSAISTTGATIKLYNNGSTTSTAANVQWLAIGN